MNYQKALLLDMKFFFNGIKEYMDFMEDYIEKSIKQFDEKYKVDTVEEYKSTDDYYYLIDELSEQWHKIDTFYPHNFRASFLAQTYSDIENKLKKICERYHFIKKTALSVNDMKGKSELSKIGNFLKTQAFIDFKSIQNDWEYIEVIGKIRNKIIHNQSSICANDKNWTVVKKFITDHPDSICFRDNLNDKDDDGQYYYKSRPHYEFSFTLNSKILNQNFIEAAERFFDELLNNKLK